MIALLEQLISPLLGVLYSLEQPLLQQMHSLQQAHSIPDILNFAQLQLLLLSVTTAAIVLLL